MTIESDPRASGTAVEWHATLRLAQPGGLHARPAAAVCTAVRGFDAHVVLLYGLARAPLQSMTALLALGVPEGANIELVATGSDAPAALAAAVKVLQADGTALGEVAEGLHAGACAEPASLSDAAQAGAPTLSAQGVLSGLTASPGIAIGRLLRLDADDIEVPEQASASSAAESRRLDQALASVDAQLLDAVRGASQRGAVEEAGIFAAHRVLLEDPALLDTARDWISLGKSAAYAWRTSIRASATVLQKVGNPLMAERANDLIDLEKRVLRALGAMHAITTELPSGTVLAARELTPSDLSDLDALSIVGIAMAYGGVTSHTAIIARQLGIPVLVGLGDALLDIADGTTVVVDANRSRLEIAPSERAVEQARSEHRDDAVALAQALEVSRHSATTRDGRVIAVAANLATLDDAQRAVEYGADAVGLLRTELMFLHRRQAPSAAEHRLNYQAVVNALDGRVASIRTLDVGADKAVEYLTVPPSPNPALGLRGVRLTGLHPALFDDQVRGLLAVEPVGAVRVLLPMITDVTDLIELRRRIEHLSQAAGRADPIEIGVMIEVPSAALLADQLAQYADFLSIGTNDLTQYALAMDRNEAAFALRADALHPAVLRLIAATVRGAQQHGRRVSVCGTLAADPEAVPLLVGLGATELSVDPAAVPAVKARVRTLDYRLCRQYAADALDLQTAEAVRARSRALWPS